MNEVVLKRHHEEYFLEQGWYFALGFREGWLVARVVQRSWSILEPWSLGAVAAGGNLATYDEVQDTQSRHYLEPYKQGIVYHTFWGVTPTEARIKVQWPIRQDLASMLAVPRSLTDNVGGIDGHHSPYRGPFSSFTEIMTVNEKYPAFQVFNPTSSPMANVKMSLDQRQYTFDFITDKTLVKEILVGRQRVKKYTMGTADPLPMTMPQWMLNIIPADLLTYTNKVMTGEV